MSYREEFPDFDRPEPIDLLISAGWTDASWRHDGCPSARLGDALIWIDFANREKRVCEVAPPFVLSFLMDGQLPADGNCREMASLKEALGAIYEEWIGYNPADEDVRINEIMLARTLAEYEQERSAA